MNTPNAEQLITRLADQIRPALQNNTAFVGIHTGGVWLAEQLHQMLGITTPLGRLNIGFHRDDYGSRGLRASTQPSDIPFDVEDSHIIIIDDILHTGRTTRAAINELFDYGRPGQIDLAVLVDRGERQLPIYARFCAHTLEQRILPSQRLLLEQEDEQLTLRLSNV